jgi:hypothetical protein
METKQSLRRRAVDLRSPSGRALFRGAMWMVVGYAGASTFALGIARLFNSEGSPLSAFACLLAGGALALYAWRRSYHVFDRIEASVTPASTQARAAATRSASGLTTLIGAPEA